MELFLFLLCVFSGVQGTLTPSDPVSLDCGSQQTFVCSVTGVAAQWNITGLSGISGGTVQNSGQALADDIGRITSTDMSGVIKTSTITITGFTTADNGGTVQCINLADRDVQGMVTVSVGIPSCPTITTSTRNTDFTAANITWSQPTTYPVTTTTVTYCPTSSPNCGNSMTCTSPCTIIGLNPCMNYSVTVTPSNNCGSATGCTMNMVDSPPKGTPECGTAYVLPTPTGNRCRTIVWNSNNSPATMLMVNYSTLSATPRSTICNTPLQKNCTIESLKPNTYVFTISPGNKCGFTTGCRKINVTVPMNATNCVDITDNPPTFNRDGAIVGGIVGFLVVVIAITMIVVIVVVCYCYPPARSACCCCVSGGSKRSTSTEPMKPRPGEDYADPQKVRENKESGKQGGITYAALEFSEQAGSTGGQNVRSNKGEAVQYMAVEHA